MTTLAGVTRTVLYLWSGGVIMYRDSELRRRVGDAELNLLSAREGEYWWDSNRQMVCEKNREERRDGEPGEDDRKQGEVMAVVRER